jgi:hypothetical protein
MREESIEEFESIFEQASIPVLKIEHVVPQRMSVVLTDGALDQSLIGVAAALQKRFQPETTVYSYKGEAGESAGSLVGDGVSVDSDPVKTTAELVGRISIARSQLVLLALSKEGQYPDIDHIVQGTSPPVLIIREPVAEPGKVFHRILHSLSGNFQQSKHFSYSFSLAQSGGSLTLLHTIEQDEILDVRDAMMVSPKTSEATARELIQQLEHHGERYLKAVTQAARDEPFHVAYRLEVGEIVPSVLATIENESFSLLVVGHHEAGHSRISAVDYQLMHLVKSIPVLAL